MQITRSLASSFKDIRANATIHYYWIVISHTFLAVNWRSKMHLIVFCDGTWNTPDQMDNGIPAPTNVVKLRNALAVTPEQHVYYHPGVGTDGGWWNRVVGGEPVKGWIITL
jgi:hypothetical protein